MSKVKGIYRTGRTYGFASSEFIVTMDDGKQHTLWSPVWNELEPEEEEAQAWEAARAIHETDDSEVEPK